MGGVGGVTALNEIAIIGSIIAEVCADHAPAQDLRLVFYGRRHHTAGSRHYDRYPAKKVRPGVATRLHKGSQRAPLAGVVQESAGCVIATGVAGLYNIAYSLSPTS